MTEMAPKRKSPGASATERRLFAYLRPHRRRLVCGLLCAAGSAGITAVIGLAIKNTLAAMTSGDLARLNLVSLAVLGVFVLNGALNYGQTYFLSYVTQRVTAQLREDILRKLHTLSLSFFNQRRHGALLSTLTADVPQVMNSLMSIRDAVSAPLVIAGSFGILFFTSPRLTLAALLTIPLMAAVITSIGRRIRKISRDVQQHFADLTSSAEETVAGVRIIKSFAAEGYETDRFVARNDRAFGAIMKGIRRSAILRPIVELLGAAGIAMVLWIGGTEVVQNTRLQAAGLPPVSRLDAGGLGMFVYLLQQIASSFRTLGQINTMRQQALAAADRIFHEVLDQHPEVADAPGAPDMPAIRGHVEFRNVSFSYNKETPVLQNVSFEVKPGEVVALVGHSGAGKSTVADLIPRFYDPDSGEIRIDGIDIRTVRSESLRRQIGIVPQETWLFAGTLRENIAYGRRDVTDEEVAAAAYAANAYFIESMPDRFETVVGERGIRLSGGERQRIAIARAVLMNPRLLILDEATSSLDASSEALVQEALEQLMQRRTTIVIAHRLSTIQNATRILVVDKGQIVESGTHPQLLASGGLYARLYERQFRTEIA